MAAPVGSGGQKRGHGNGEEEGEDQRQRRRAGHLHHSQRGREVWKSYLDEYNQWLEVKSTLDDLKTQVEENILSHERSALNAAALVLGSDQACAQAAASLGLDSQEEDTFEWFSTTDPNPPHADALVRLLGFLAEEDDAFTEQDKQDYENHRFSIIVHDLATNWDALVQQGEGAVLVGEHGMLRVLHMTPRLAMDLSADVLIPQYAQFVTNLWVSPSLPVSQRMGYATRMVQELVRKYGETDSLLVRFKKTHSHLVSLYVSAGFKHYNHGDPSPFVLFLRVQTRLDWHHYTSLTMLSNEHRHWVDVFHKKRTTFDRIVQTHSTASILVSQGAFSVMGSARTLPTIRTVLRKHLPSKVVIPPDALFELCSVSTSEAFPQKVARLVREFYPQRMLALVTRTDQPDKRHVLRQYEFTHFFPLNDKDTVGVRIPEPELFLLKSRDPPSVIDQWAQSDQHCHLMAYLTGDRSTQDIRRMFQDGMLFDAQKLDLCVDPGRFNTALGEWSRQINQASMNTNVLELENLREFRLLLLRQPTLGLTLGGLNHLLPFLKPLRAPQLHTVCVDHIQVFNEQAQKELDHLLVELAKVHLMKSVQVLVFEWTHLTLLEYAHLYRVVYVVTQNMPWIKTLRFARCSVSRHLHKQMHEAFQGLRTHRVELDTASVRILHERTGEVLDGFYYRPDLPEPVPAAPMYGPFLPPSKLTQLTGGSLSNALSFLTVREQRQFAGAHRSVRQQVMNVEPDARDALVIHSPRLGAWNARFLHAAAGTKLAKYATGVGTQTHVKVVFDIHDVDTQFRSLERQADRIDHLVLRYTMNDESSVPFNQALLKQRIERLGQCFQYSTCVLGRLHTLTLDLTFPTLPVQRPDYIHAVHHLLLWLGERLPVTRAGGHPFQTLVLRVGNLDHAQLQMLFSRVSNVPFVRFMETLVLEWKDTLYVDPRDFFQFFTPAFLRQHTLRRVQFRFCFMLSDFELKFNQLCFELGMGIVADPDEPTLTIYDAEWRHFRVEAFDKTLVVEPPPPPPPAPAPEEEEEEDPSDDEQEGIGGDMALGLA